MMNIPKPVPYPTSVEHSLWSNLAEYRNWIDKMATKKLIGNLAPEICVCAFEIIKECHNDSSTN